ncbi:MAG: hypothetical protein GY703_24345, partial [Gammaproteobacteria bacterium]|nr:hypothetical protein [Gammaproteobacteria bacterium]
QSEAPGNWFDCHDCRGRSVQKNWLGDLEGTSLEDHAGNSQSLYNVLLGGEIAQGLSACDVISFPLGQSGPVLSGVVWRLLLEGDAATAAEVGENLAVARGRKQGLLINPHMEAWLMAGTENR